MYSYAFKTWFRMHIPSYPHCRLRLQAQEVRKPVLVVYIGFVPLLGNRYRKETD